MSDPQKKILLFGAGKSTAVLIHYLLDACLRHNWQLTIADSHAELVAARLQQHPHGVAFICDVNHDADRSHAIAQADIVISMLPPALHFIVAKDCIHFRKNLLTASYLDNNIKSLEKEITSAGLFFLYETGLDPGIDHMSAMQIIQEIRDKGGQIKQFISHCGGLVAPESDNNPWHYKISWNPANVVNAGKSGAIYLRDHTIIDTPYNRIFENIGTVELPGLSKLAYYPNRDSLAYQSVYGLTEAATFMRTTLRHPHFCTGWKYMIKAGLTTDAMIPGAHYNGIPLNRWFQDRLNQSAGLSSFQDFLDKVVLPADRAIVTTLFDYLGLFSSDLIPENLGTPVLQFLLETRLKLAATDKDMIVMLHEIEYEIDSQPGQTKSWLIVKGENEVYTAMAQTVGLPLAIATELLLTRQLTLTGLHIPIKKEIYTPILQQLKDNGISFNFE